MLIIPACNSGGGGGGDAGNRAGPGGGPIPTLAACEDTKDNDGDTLIDLADPGCEDVGDTSERGTDICDNRVDEDGDTRSDFPNDPGCSSIADTSELGTNECDDGIDNDGDTLIDLADPGCDDVEDTSEHGTGICDDGADNDGDTLSDLADPGCLGDVFNGTEIGACQDGIDNDGDTQTDSPSDPGCQDAADLNELGTNECDDGIDNDGDVFIDYKSDPGCLDLTDLSENGSAICDDGLDNDGDTFSDIADPGCLANPSGSTEIGECQDGLNNDEDALVDYPADPGCSDISDASEYGTNECDDGIDNDGDTIIDFPDPGCYGDPSEMAEADVKECEDGTDNDGDTLTDFAADPGCMSLTDASELGTNECDDEIDNDSDTFVDYTNDPECNSVLDTSESNYIYVWVDSPSLIEDGTIDNPYKSIQAGINAASAGEDVLVALGTYYEWVILKAGVDVRGGFDASFLYNNRDPNLNRTVVVPDIYTAFYGPVGTDIVVDGFEISGGWKAFDFLSSSPTLSNNYIHNSTHGIFSYVESGMVAYPYLIDNTISDISGLGIKFYGRDNAMHYPIIKYNLIESNGIEINHNSDPPWPFIASGKINAIISNSFIKGGGIKVRSRSDGTCYPNPSTCGAKNFAVADVHMYNSIITNSDVAIDIYSRAYFSAYPAGWNPARAKAYVNNTTIANNNISMARNSVGLNTQVGYVVRNSIFANNINNDLGDILWPGGGAYYTNFWNPASCNVCSFAPHVQFVDPLLNSDFTLQASSPLIDAGDPDASYDDALPPGQGTSRNDMGAFGGPGASGIIGTRTPFSP